VKGSSLNKRGKSIFTKSRTVYYEDIDQEGQILGECGRAVTAGRRTQRSGKEMWGVLFGPAEKKKDVVRRGEIDRSIRRPESQAI